MDLWLASIALFSIATTLNAINTLTTITNLRCEGPHLGASPAHRLGMVHRRAAKHPRLLRPASGDPPSLL